MLIRPEINHALKTQKPSQMEGFVDTMLPRHLSSQKA
jgi:hypothetical protein